MRVPLIAILLAFLFACVPEGTDWQVSEVKAPAGEGGQPNLFVAETGQLYLSWVAYLDDTTDALLFAVWEDGAWSAPREIASGTDWFVNWADFPSIAAYPGGGNVLAAHWLAKSAGGTYDYDVHISQSADGGQSWSPSFIPHRDGLAAEHGFVSMQPLSADRMLAVWLDGRNTKTEEASTAGHEHGHGGPMSLRSAVFDPQGELGEESELDDRVCDCCQTDLALTQAGPIAVYRDRSESEVRDIYCVRQIDGRWTSPSPVYDDGWTITACPVNGPAVAAHGTAVAVAWFTAANDRPTVKVAFSQDAGATFEVPIRLDDGRPEGRVDLEWLDEERIVVSWQENTDAGAEIRYALVSRKGKEGASQVLTNTDPSRQSGFPILARTTDKLWFAWTQVDSTTTLRTAFLKL